VKFYTNIQLIGNQFLIRGYDNGKHITHREEWKPTLFVPSKRKTKYKTLEGDSVEPIQPGFVRDCREFYKKYDEVENFKIYGNDRYVYQYISEKYPQDHIQFDIKKIRLVTIDIEVAAESGFPDVENVAEELLLISLQDYATKKVTTFGSRPFVNKDPNVTYILCNDEVHLLRSFLAYWRKNLPEVITGWNSQMYDIPYLAGRINRILGEKSMKDLSPWGLVSQDEVYISGRKNITYDIGGVTQLDYLDLYKRFTYTNQESYRLDYIANYELGEKKLDHDEYDTFREFYTKDWDKFVRYNIIDVQLVDKLEDKLKLIELAITMAFDAKVNFIDIHYQVRMWDTIIYNYLKKQNIVIPPKKRTSKSQKYAGAYVKEPKPGKYDWVVSFDLNSLYPHLIMQYNISPETLKDDKHPTATDDTFAPEGCDSFYVLCPVPNLQGNVQWNSEGPKLKDRIVEALDKTIMPGLKENIEAEFWMTPEDFKNDYRSKYGAGFSVAPIFSQSAWFRYHNKDKKIPNLYFSAAGSHPGAGIPGVLCSAKVIEKLIIKDFKVSH